MSEQGTPRPTAAADAMDRARREERADRDEFIADRIETSRRLAEAITTGRVPPVGGAA